MSEGNVRFAFALCLAVTCLAPIVSKAADRKGSGGPWIATAVIIRNEEQPGAGVYLKSGLIITAAHLTAVDAKMSVRIAGVVLPAQVLKQGSSEDVDLSLLWVDEQKLPSPQSSPFTLRTKFSMLIGDVSSTGNSGCTRHHQR